MKYLILFLLTINVIILLIIMTAIYCTHNYKTRYIIHFNNKSMIECLDISKCEDVVYCKYTDKIEYIYFGYNIDRIESIKEEL